MADEERLTFHHPSGLWFPWNESRPDKMYSALKKYQHDPDFMLDLLPPKARKRVCVQAGGHIGFRPLMLAPHFGRVLTFEPDPPVSAALQRNVWQHRNITPVWGALGESNGTAEFSYYSGRTAVSTMAEVKKEGDLSVMVPVYTIDSFVDEDVAAIMLDVEGYEPWVLRGAVETIAHCHPLIVCEMLDKSKDEITSTLAGMGYLPVDNLRNRKCRDVLFTFEGRA